MSQQGKRKPKVCWTSLHNEKSKIFLRTLCAFSILVQFSKIRSCKPEQVQPHTSYARLLVFDKTSAQLHFVVVNCSDVVMSVFYSPVLTHSLIFLQLWTAVS